MVRTSLSAATLIALAESGTRAMAHVAPWSNPDPPLLPVQFLIGITLMAIAGAIIVWQALILAREALERADPVRVGSGGRSSRPERSVAHHGDAVDVPMSDRRASVAPTRWTSGELHGREGALPCGGGGPAADGCDRPRTDRASGADLAGRQHLDARDGGAGGDAVPGPAFAMTGVRHDRHRPSTEGGRLTRHRHRPWPAADGRAGSRRGPAVGSSAEETNP